MNTFVLPGPCPAGFTGIWRCHRQLPAATQFVVSTIGSSSVRYVYSPDRTKYIDARILDAPRYTFNKLPSSAQSLDSIKTNAISGVATHDVYKGEVDRLNNEMRVIIANVEKEKKLSDAFKALQQAENARDTAPVAYQQARTTYYTLLRGDTWKNEEKERLAKAEIDPEIQQLRNYLTDSQQRLRQQQQTVDIVDGLKTNVLSLKDDFKYSTDTLQRQVEKLKQQIQFDVRKRAENDKGSVWELLDRVLNYAIVAVLAFAAFMIYKMIRSPKPADTTSTSTDTSTQTVGGSLGIAKFLKKYLPIPA